MNTVTIAAITGVAAFVLGAACSELRHLAKSGKKSAKPSRDSNGASRAAKAHPAPADGSIEIYVGNLSYELTEDRLRKEFEAYGKVNSARIITNRFNGKSKGFGFVHMPNRAEVEAALAGLGDKEILGRKMKCNVAKTMS